MGRYVYKLPDIGEGIAEAEVVKWHAEAGAAIREDQPLVDVMTDKATVEIAAPVSGVLRERHGKEGQKLAVGAALAVFETDSAAPVAELREKPAAAAERPEPSARSEAKCLAAPAVRARARMMGMDLSTIQPSGPGGRVLHEDLDRMLLARGTKPADAPPKLPDGVEEIRVFGLRRRIAERMQESKRRIPHFTYVEEVDVEDVERLRDRLNSEVSDGHLTLLPFLIRALVTAIAAHPEVNSHYDGEQGIIRRYTPVHVGIATQTERGVLVPVIHHAERLGLRELSTEIHRLAQAARAGKSAREELTGSTITVTSLGALGGLMATPIINPPEVAIIGINRIRESVVLRDGEVGTRRVMNLSSSFDHRIVDGFVAASFIASLRKALEQPSGL